MKKQFFESKNTTFLKLKINQYKFCEKKNSFENNIMTKNIFWK